MLKKPGPVWDESGTATRDTVRSQIAAILRNVHSTAAVESARFRDLEAHSRRLDARVRELTAEAERYMVGEAGQVEASELLSVAAALQAAGTDGRRLNAELAAWDARYDAFAASVQAHVERLRAEAADAGLDFDAIDEEARVVLSLEARAS